MSLSINLGKINLKSCIMNASGARCTTSDELDSLSNSHASMIITKTCSIEKREGNPKPRYYHNSEISVNSMGLPNEGFDYYLSLTDNLSNKKPVIISIATLDLENVRNMLTKTINCPNVSGIEINISCPNICNTDSILAYHFEDLDKYLESINDILKNNIDKEIGIKLPPYWEPYQFKQISQIIIKYNFTFVTLVNSVPNCLVIDTETEAPVIKPKNGIGGLGGKYIKPVVLSNIYQLKKLLPNNIQLIGCGGIITGEDIFHHLLAGASMVQVGTVLMMEGYGVFERLENELLKIMDTKNYSSLHDIIGNIKETKCEIDGNMNY